ncbi:MAG: hypothetical protein NC336_06265 [Clostridium sp.]|nr:hypothetical protein [Clostridium sp.]
MKNHYLLASLSIAAGLVTTSCFDDNYDLSDIDTTVRVDVKDLVVPINLDQLSLSSIIDIKEGERVQVVDGVYAVVDSGSFTSSSVEIGELNLGEPTINPSDTKIYLETGSTGIQLPGGEYQFGSYSIKSDPAEFLYESDNVDRSIVSIDSITSEITLKINIELQSSFAAQTVLDFTDVVFQLPRGLEVTDSDGGKYDPKTGELTFAKRRENGREFSVSITAVGIDFAQIGGTLGESGSNYVAKIEGSCYVKSGDVSVVASSTTSFSAPEEIDMRTTFTLSPLTVRTFTGTVRYDIENVSINDIELSDLPDVISQDGTRLYLDNPRIYFHANNPVQQYGLTVRSGLTIDSYPRQAGAPVLSNSINDGTFTIGADAPGAIYNFCIAPNPDGGIAGYENAIPVRFTGLSDVLATEGGLPSRLAIKLDNPEIPATRVSRFRLGTTLGDVEGRYKFIAPLQLKAGSQVCYSDTLDGWSDEDLDCLTITGLVVELDVTTDLPIGATLSGYPIDANGNRINNVSIEGAVIEPNARNQHLNLYITGEVKHLDGIVFEAVASAADGQALSPSMTIELKNVRPRVSGWYQKEL